MLTDEDDFDGSVLTVMFPADEDQPLISVEVPVRINDDTMDEAEEQTLFVVLEMTNATKPQSVLIKRNLSRCTIVDNDGKCSISLMVQRKCTTD